MKHVYQFLVISICYFTLLFILPNSCCSQVYHINKEFYSVNNDTLHYQDMRDLFTTPEQLAFYEGSIKSQKTGKGFGRATLATLGLGGALIFFGTGEEDIVANPFGLFLVYFVAPITALIGVIAGASGQTKRKKAINLLNESYPDLEPKDKLSLELVPSSYGAGLGLRLSF